MVIFHSYVSLPEGNPHQSHQLGYNPYSTMVGYTVYMHIHTNYMR